MLIHKSYNAQAPRAAFRKDAAHANSPPLINLQIDNTEGVLAIADIPFLVRFLCPHQALFAAPIFSATQDMNSPLVGLSMASKTL